MDDNVPPDNTYMVVNALIKANKDFDLLILPNQRHGYGSQANYMMRRRWDYFVKNLLGAEPPKEYVDPTQPERPPIERPPASRNVDECGRCNRRSLISLVLPTVVRRTGAPGGPAAQRFHDVRPVAGQQMGRRGLGQGRQHRRARSAG